MSELAAMQMATPMKDDVPSDGGWTIAYGAQAGRPTWPERAASVGLAADGRSEPGAGESDEYSSARCKLWQPEQDRPHENESSVLPA